MPNWNDIAKQIEASTEKPFTVTHSNHVGGGCINSAMIVSDGSQHFFVKLNQAHLLHMFEAEFEGLLALSKGDAIRVPDPICFGTTEGNSYLVLEYLALGGSGNAENAGEQLAALHRNHQDRFGWQRDNTIGSTLQSNRDHSDWIDFWREERLGFQFKLAQRNGAPSKLVDRANLLLERLPALIDHKPQPSLLHGDLWGGNFSYTQSGEPVIFDPAVYYGDRETDLAMTELFGGFSHRFYTAYNNAWPLDAGYRSRKTLYNLYHILNHFNLFGGGYANQALGMTDQLLAELG